MDGGVWVCDDEDRGDHLDLARQQLQSAPHSRHRRCRAGGWLYIRCYPVSLIGLHAKILLNMVLSFAQSKYKRGVPSFKVTKNFSLDMHICLNPSILIYNLSTTYRQISTRISKLPPAPKLNMHNKLVLNKAKTSHWWFHFPQPTGLWLLTSQLFVHYTHTSEPFGSWNSRWQGVRVYQQHQHSDRTSSSLFGRTEK